MCSLLVLGVAVVLIRMTVTVVLIRMTVEADLIQMAIRSSCFPPSCPEEGDSFTMPAPKVL